MSSRSARRRRSRSKNFKYFAGGRHKKCGPWRTPKPKRAKWAGSRVSSEPQRFAGMDRVAPGVYVARESHSILPLPKLPKQQGLVATVRRVLFD